MRVSQVTLLHEYLERAAGRDTHKTALVFKKRRLTWGDVHVQAGRVANALRAAGLRRGDRVVLYLDNSVELAVGIFGVLAADGIFSVVNAQTKADKLAYMLRDCRARILISDKVLERFWRPAVESSEHLEAGLIVDLVPPASGASAASTTSAGTAPQERAGRVALFDWSAALAAADTAWPSARNIPVDLAAIIYTSGSTGDPKGVMLTHTNMVSAAESITTYLRNQPDDVVIDVLPLSFDYGLYQWLMVNQFGGTLVLETSFNYPAAAIKLIQDEGVTGLPVVPTIASILRQYEAKGLRLPQIRYVTNTAAALSLPHIETLKKVCENARIYSMYGLTECKRVSYLPPERLADKPTSVGIAMPNMEVFIAAPDGSRLPPNEIGELVIRGPHVMRGYWEKPEVTAEWLKPGAIPGEMYLWSGDQFKMDEEGFLYFIGRKDDIIKTRGEKVSPKEVENVLYELTGVQDAAVAGRTDDVLGQAIHAFLVLTEGTTYSAAQVLQHCTSRLEPFMVPKYVTFLSSIPKTPSGKITKKNIWDHGREARLSGDELP